MNAERWNRAKALLAEASDRPAADRRQFILDRCEDAALRAELLLMLDSPAPLTAILESGSVRVGTQLGAYRIDASLGQGGMGEVYRARDTRLGRDVAIKVLPALFAGDRERLARFDREARVLASLSHPHICTLFDVGRDDGVDYLVMERVNGESLAECLARGPLARDKAIEYAGQIADALDAAHSRGIVHRDLKPANVMLTSSGAKLLDFGLAKSSSATEPAETSPADLTTEGALLGTRRYMSPEQLDTAEADARSDIWALGCLLFEMLVGRPAFDAKTQASLVAAILDHEPPAVSTLSAGAPPALDHVIRRCLAKSPADRWQSAADVKHELRWIAESGTKAAVPAMPAGRRVPWIVSAVVTAVAVAGIAAAVGMRGPVAEAPRRPTRFTLGLPEMFQSPIFMTISTDGRQIAFLDKRKPTDAEGLVWVRSLDSIEPRPVPGTEGEQQLPFWSPDGASIGFFVGGKLRRVNLASGAVQAICDAAAARGGTWAPDGTIVFAPSAASALYRVPSTGGAPGQLTTLNASAGETSHRLPNVLSDGRHFIFTVLGNGWYGLALGSLDSQTTTTLMKWPADPRSPFETTQGIVAGDRLWFVRNKSLFAQRLNVGAQRLEGEALPIAAGVGQDYLGVQAFAVSGDSVVFRSAAAHRAQRYQLTWMARDGKPGASMGEPAVLAGMSIAPNGRRLAVSRVEPATSSANLWIVDLDRGLSSRLTDGQYATDPLWSRDGNRLYYSVVETLGLRSLYSVAADGSGTPERLLDGSTPDQRPAGWAADGALIYTSLNSPADGTARYGLWKLPLNGSRRPTLLFEGQGYEFGDAAPSPDGQLVVFPSRGDLFVQPIAGGPRMQIASGIEDAGPAQWSADSRQLFYRAGGRLMGVEFRGPGVEFSEPKPLFAYSSASWDIVPAADALRFVAALPVEGAARPVSPAITVILNASSGLK